MHTPSSDLRSVPLRPSGGLPRLGPETCDRGRRPHPRWPPCGPSPVVLHVASLVGQLGQLCGDLPPHRQPRELDNDVAGHLLHELQCLDVITPGGKDLTEPGQVLLEVHLHLLGGSGHLQGGRGCESGLPGGGSQRRTCPDSNSGAEGLQAAGGQKPWHPPALTPLHGGWGWQGAGPIWSSPGPGLPGGDTKRRIHFASLRIPLI